MRSRITLHVIIIIVIIIIIIIIIIVIIIIIIYRSYGRVAEVKSQTIRVSRVTTRAGRGGEAVYCTSYR